MSEKSLLDRILDPGGLSVLFQPIFEVGKDGTRMHALECLLRGPKGTNMEAADVLFEYVRRKQEETLVDQACVAAAFEAAGTLPWKPDISVNVHASTLGRDRAFVSFIREAAKLHSIPTSRLIVEIVEHTPFWDGQSFHLALEQLRSMGVRIALDDIGIGQSNYRMIIECRPDYFKVDRYLVKDCHVNADRKAVLESISELAWKLDARVVAEGVETREDLQAVMDLGIDLVQGFLLSPPVPSATLIARASLPDGGLPAVSGGTTSLPQENASISQSRPAPALHEAG